MGDAAWRHPFFLRDKVQTVMHLHIFVVDFFAEKDKITRIFHNSLLASRWSLLEKLDANVDLIEDFSSFFKSACVEHFLHGQLRQGFLIGWAVMFAAGIMGCLWISLHPDTHSYVTISGVLFCVGIGLIGGLIQTNTDVEDQEAGRYSKMGSGWNFWGDNIIFNKMNQSFSILLIVGSFAASIYIFIEGAHQEAEAKVTRVTPKAVAQTLVHPQIHSSSVAHHHKNKKSIHHQTEK